MTYTVGGLIQAADYNGFVQNTAGANLNTIWGAGSGDTGYGQSTTLPTVTTGAVVSATQWSALNNRISAVAAQTNTTITSRTNPVATNTIAILNNLNTDIVNCTANRGNAFAVGTTSNSWLGNTARTVTTGSGTAPWTLTWTHTVTFGSADQARYFWNAGGLVRLDMSKTSTGTGDDVSWNALVAQIGTLYVSGRVNSASQTIAGTSYTGFTRIGGSGTPSTFTPNVGWYSLTGGAAASTLFQLSPSTSPYSGDYIRVAAAVNSPRTALTLTTTWVSAGSGTDASISGGTDTTSPFSGTFGTAPAVLCRFVPPSTTYLTNTWGTPAVTASVVSS